MANFFIRILAFSWLLFVGFMLLSQKHVTIYMIGDSTMANKPLEDNPERGWGQLLPNFFDSTITIDNHAMNGRSTRSFLRENRWQPILDKLQPGDYVIIQFGHNDQSKDKVDRYTPPEDFKVNLLKFVTETREKKAVPILCTPVVRRRFDEKGNFYDVHGEYPDLVRQVASENNVLLLEMHRKSEAYIKGLGEEESKRVFLWVEPGMYKSLPDGRVDNTHFSEFGALKMAEIAVNEIKERNIELTQHLKNISATSILQELCFCPPTYSNPIIFGDYSDPDVIRVGNDFYMVSSSFNCVPGIPVLHSTDLVSWTIIGHVLQSLPAEYDTPQHGKGVWAPSIRFHNGEFWVYYGDPDQGIYMCKTKNPAGIWDAPVLVKEVKGWIDPCPFWDDNGDAFLIHAWAKSRVGFNSILTLNKMSSDGTYILDSGVTVFDGHKTQSTIEGPKLYNRNGYYYIFAPAGGVKNGWQTVLRSKNLYGHYEEKIVMDKGTTTINGPHQGAWIETASNESWFIHFQDRGIYGRVTHLQPMKWSNDWPIIGNDPDGDGKGEPVLTYKMPDVPECTFSHNLHPVLQMSDDFSAERLSPQWQWQATPKPDWVGYKGRKGCISLFPVFVHDGETDFLPSSSNLLLQKFSAPSFTATTLFRCDSLADNATAGLVVMGLDHAYVGITRGGDSIVVEHMAVHTIRLDEIEQSQAPLRISADSVFLKVAVDSSGMCNFSFSHEGTSYTDIGKPFKAREGTWIGAKVGLFCITNDEEHTLKGSVDVDWFRINTMK